jgi:hypothetical protein
MAEQPGTAFGRRKSTPLIAIVALVIAIASLGFSAWQQLQQRKAAEVAGALEAWTATMERHAVSDLSFQARTLLTHVIGELHIAQFLCMHSSDPALKAKAEYLELAVEGQSKHSSEWRLSHQAQEDELDRIDSRLAAGALESAELEALANQIAAIKGNTQDQLKNIWATSAECLKDDAAMAPEREN